MMTSTPPSPSRLRRQLAGDLTAVLIAATLTLVIPIGTLAIAPFDEGLYCSTTVDMVEHNRLLYPTKDGQFFSWYGKPPLVNWLQMVSTRVFGESVVGWRLPTALGMAALIALIWASGVALGGRVVGAIAAALALLSPELLNTGRRIWLEDLVAPLFAAGVLSYAYGIAKLSTRRWLGLAGAGLAFGLAILTKQAFALFAPAAMGITELILRRPGWMRRLLVVAAVTCLVSAWWFLWTAHAVGQPAIDSWFNYHIVARFTDVLEGHARKPNAYAISLQNYIGVVPWALALFGWALLWSKTKATRATEEINYPLYIGWSVLFVLQYVVVGLTIKTYLPWYQVVVMAPLFVGAAYLTHEIWLHGNPTWVRWLVPVTLVAGMASPTRADGVTIALLIVGAAFWSDKAPRWLARLLNPRTLLLAAGVVATVAANPTRQLDWRRDVATRLGHDSPALMVGENASLFAWRCYLPRATWHDWPGSCGEVERLVAQSTTFVLDGQATSCVIAGTRALFTHPQTLILTRDTAGQAPAKPAADMPRVP